MDNSQPRLSTWNPSWLNDNIHFAGAELLVLMPQFTIRIMTPAFVLAGVIITDRAPGGLFLPGHAALAGQFEFAGVVLLPRLGDGLFTLG